MQTMRVLPRPQLEFISRQRDSAQPSQHYSASVRIAPKLHVRLRSDGRSHSGTMRLQFHARGGGECEWEQWWRETGMPLPGRCTAERVITAERVRAHGVPPYNMHVAHFEDLRLSVNARSIGREHDLSVRLAEACGWEGEHYACDGSLVDAQ